MSGETQIVWDDPEAVVHFKGTPAASLDVAATAWEAAGARFSEPLGDGMDDLDDGGRMAVATAATTGSTHRFAVHDDGDGSGVFLFVETAPDAARAAAIEVIAALVADGLVTGEAVRDLFPSTSEQQRGVRRESQVDMSLPVRIGTGNGVVVRAADGGVLITRIESKARRFKRRTQPVQRRVQASASKAISREGGRVIRLRRFELTAGDSEVIIFESDFDGGRR